MSKNILFTFVGTTDPIRNNYDGSMLHIIRHYKPSKVYIFFSKEMGERERADSRFSRSIQLLSERMNIPVEVDGYFSGIKDAHDFDAYIDAFAEYVDKIKNNHPDDCILLNLSSGTPQMKSMMCLEAVASVRPLVPVQVATPVGRANSSKVSGNIYDIDLEFENNLDNEPGMPNRCSEPDIMSFRRTIVKGQIMSMVKNYQYKAAKTLVDNFYSSINRNAYRLIEHAIYRMSLEDSLAVRTIAEINDVDLYPVKDIDCRKVCEYFNVLKIYQKTGELAGFILRLNPLIVKLQSEVLKKCYGFDVKKITRRLPNGEVKISLELMRSLDADMVNYISYEFYSNQLRESTLNIRIQNGIINYLSKKNKLDHDQLNLKFFKVMENLNREYRDSLAHQLCGVMEEDIIKLSEMTSASIVNRVEKIIKFLYGNRCKEEIFIIYDIINDKILQEIDKKQI